MASPSRTTSAPAATPAHHLGARGYPVVNVLPSVTTKTKEIEDNSPLETDAKDAALIAKLVGDGSFVRFPWEWGPRIGRMPSRHCRRSPAGARGIWCQRCDD
jgi:hypothetical protein